MLAKPPAHLKSLFDRLLAQGLTAEDKATLRAALLSGQVTKADGEGAVAIGGSVSFSTIHTGDILKADIETLRQALANVHAEIHRDVEQRSLQAYFQALRRHCANPPYLSLSMLPGSRHKTLNEVYIPLRFKTDVETVVASESLFHTDAADADKKPALVLGNPGSGKSTLLRMLALQAYDQPEVLGLNRPHLPLLVRLPSLAVATGASVSERLAQALNHACEPIMDSALPTDFVNAWSKLLNAPWMFFFDSFDETPTAQRLELINWLKQLLEICKEQGHRMMLSSRHITDAELFSRERFKVFEVQPFAAQQRQAFAQHWFGADADAFIQELNTAEAGRVPGTPLLLTIAASVYAHDNQLPAKPTDLYKRYIDIWLHEAEVRKLNDELGADLSEIVLPTLEHLALKQTERPELVTRTSWLPLVADFIGKAFQQLSTLVATSKAERMLEVLGRRIGVFNIRNERIEWGHPNFREYLAARAFEQDRVGAWDNYAQLLAGKLQSDQWAEVLRKLAEITAEPIALVEQLCTEALQSNHEQAFTTISELWKTNQALSSHILDSLLAKLVDPNTTVRNRAARALGSIDQPRYYLPHDDDFWPALKTGERLWVAAQTAAEEELLWRMKQPYPNDDWRRMVQNKLICALGTCCTPEGAKTVLRYLREGDGKGFSLNFWQEAIVPLLVRNVVTTTEILMFALDPSTLLYSRIPIAASRAYNRLVTSKLLIVCQTF